MACNLLVQSFGSEKEYRRSIFMVLSFFAHCSLQNDRIRVVFYTDKPSYFKYFFSGLPIVYKTLTLSKIDEMRGTIDFLHRMKIAMIKETFNAYQEDIIYADSDSFFTGDICPHFQKLNPSTAFMHKKEYFFCTMEKMALPGGQPFVDFYHKVVNHSFALNSGRSYSIDEQMASWNAGVMMLHNSFEEVLDDVFGLTDEFFLRTKNHACEQYAFSVVLQTIGELQPCEHINYHYWYRVKKQIVDVILSNLLDASFSNDALATKLLKAQNLIMVLPDLMETHILALRDSAIQAFNRNEWMAGYQYALKALRKNPFNLQFLRDMLYHTKRRLFDAQRN